jgi:cytochrome c-type biogenesis protein CcmH/NrfG
MHFRGLALALLALASARADSGAADGVALYHRHEYAAAAAALERVVAAEPGNAVACHFLGLALNRAGGPRAHDDALPWLRKAAALAPSDSDVIGDYGGVCLQLADEHHSFTYALRGRSLLEQAVSLNPADLDAREGLMEFYARAPWPLGDAPRAVVEATEIARRSPRLGARAWDTLGRIRAGQGDAAGARDAYGRALRLEPRDPVATRALAGLK